MKGGGTYVGVLDEELEGVAEVGLVELTRGEPVLTLP